MPSLDAGLFTCWDGRVSNDLITLGIVVDPHIFSFGLLANTGSREEDKDGERNIQMITYCGFVLLSTC